MNKPLVFDKSLGIKKPVTLEMKTQNTKACPFCNTQELTNILDRQGNIIWLMNKYPVLRDTWQTVIIETDDDQGEFSTYPSDHAARVFRFALEKWQATMARPEFKSVLYLKNHGPMSGGSLRHPHSQIIGLYQYDYRQDITIDNFTGWELFEDQEILITLSQQPNIGFTEYNIRFHPNGDLGHVALRLQELLRYTLHSVARFTHSYNYFFYDIQDGYYYIKVIPRYVTTPLYVGYKIPQVLSDADALRIQQDLLEFMR